MFLYKSKIRDKEKPGLLEEIKICAKRGVKGKDALIPREECGVCGVYNNSDAANLAYLGLYALQHRGQESAGIATTNGENLYRFAGMGKVAEIFNQSKLDQLEGKVAIGQNRYSTSGASFLRNAQPLRMLTHFGPIALAHNGNLTNSTTLRKRLENEGSILQTTVDTEVIAHLMAKSGKDKMVDAVIFAINQIKGAYSLLILTRKKLIAIRDPHGFRPLVMGKVGDTTVFASETCALDIMDAEYIRDVKPGEMVVMEEGKIVSLFPFEGKNGSASYPRSLCIFEHIYFARPDSIIFRESVYDFRINLGKQLARESYIDADLVVPVPDSSLVAAIGFSQESKIPYSMGLIRSHYIGRTFIEPEQKIRDFGAKIKYNVVKAAIKGKKVILVDDSIMRGTTSRKIIKMFRKGGVMEIHMRISAPPTRFPCYYGIDIPTSGELIASSNTVEEIRKYIGVDSLRYLSEEGMVSASARDVNFCKACFDGNYITPLEEGYDRRQNLLFQEMQVEES